MPQFSKVHRVGHSAERMFDLVMDVEKYPEFLPLCEALRVRSRRAAEGREILIADMTVGYKAIRETFTTQDIANRADLTININYLNGPFRRLDNRWRFVPVGDNACDVHFSIDYEFSNRVLAMLMGAMFDRAFRKFTAAFEARADAIYGRPPGQGKAIA
jgi:coenzyme Q-binding protein COQ10